MPKRGDGCSGATLLTGMSKGMRAGVRMCVCGRPVAPRTVQPLPGAGCEDVGLWSTKNPTAWKPGRPGNL